MGENQDWMRRSLAAVWHPCTQMKAHEAIPLVPISHGAGCWLYDFEGKRYLDAISSWWVNLFGHCNPKINAALQQQLGRLEHLILAGFTQEPVVRLSERLSALTGNHLGHCFYASDGASATEIALKMSFHFWQNSGRSRKRNFLSLQNGYHGETVGALSVTDVALFKEAYAPLLRLAATMPTPDWRLAEAGESRRDFALRRALDLEAYLERRHEDTAALILEPLIQCATGMAMYDPVYLQRARQLCDRFHVHLIADEIAVGCGRTGTFFAHEQAEIRPDFLCLSKGISGGYLPLSVVLTTEEIYQAFYSDETTRGFLHSHSYTGNALACTAALATLDIFEQGQVLTANRERSARLTALCEPLRNHPRVRHFRNRGMIWAFDVEHADSAFARTFFSQALVRGLLLRPIGNTVYFMPPYVITDEEMALLASGALSVVREVTGVV